MGVRVAGQNESTGAAVAFPGRDADAVGGTLGFLSPCYRQLHHESGPPRLKTDVLGLDVAGHPAQQQHLPEQEETQRAVRWREHQAEARRVRNTFHSFCDAVARVEPFLLLMAFYILACGCGRIRGFCCFRVPLEK